MDASERLARTLESRLEQAQEDHTQQRSRAPACSCSFINYSNHYCCYSNRAPCDCDNVKPSSSRSKSENNIQETSTRNRKIETSLQEDHRASCCSCSDSGRSRTFTGMRLPHSFALFTLLNLLLLLHDNNEILLGGSGPPMVMVANAEPIEVTRFQVPAQVRPGEMRRLTCQYKLHGASLHAMKLFKDDQEFFRFTPTDQKMSFPGAGVQVDMNRSNEREVWLKINKRSSGQYKCQVLIEGTFRSVSVTKRMEVLIGGESALATGSASGGLHGGAPASAVWQHHPSQQQDQAKSARPLLTRQQHSAVQQHPSQLYGLNSLMGGGGGGSSSGSWSLNQRECLATARVLLWAWALWHALALALALQSPRFQRVSMGDGELVAALPTRRPP